MASDHPSNPTEQVTGSAVSGPDAGFGPLWRKTFQVGLSDISIEPTELIALWKREFGTFWPGVNRFQAPLTGLSQGELAEVKLEIPGGAALSTGVWLLYAETTAFALAAPPGHVISGWNTMSSLQLDGVTYARIEILMRASDPMFAVSLAIGGHRRENQFWLDVLVNLARRCNSNANPTATTAKIDRRVMIRNARNLRQNAILRNGFERSRSLWRHRPGRFSQSISREVTPE